MVKMLVVVVTVVGLVKTVMVVGMAVVEMVKIVMVVVYRG